MEQPIIDTPIIAFIKGLQQKKGWKDNELAERLGVTPSSVCLIKQGNARH